MRSIVIVAAASFLAGLLLAVPALSGSNLLDNPAMEQGSGDRPDSWRRQRMLPGAGSFAWVRKPRLAGELEITNRSFDVAQWIQSLTLEPGWYRLSGEVQGQGEEGEVMLGVGLRHSAEGWSPRPAPDADRGRFGFGEFYFKVDKTREVLIVCRLSGRGSARFRHLGLTRVAAPDPGALQADLGAIEAQHKTNQLHFNAKPFDQPTGRTWSEIALLAALAALFTWGWRELGSARPRRD